MKNSHRGFIAPLLLVLIALILIGGGAYVYVQKSSDKRLVNSPPGIASSTVDTSTSLIKKFDPRFPGEVTSSGFVIPSEGEGTYPNLKSMESTARDILIKTNPDIATFSCGTSLIVVGHRYVLLSVWNGRNDSGRKSECAIGDFVIDFIEKTSKRISTAGDYSSYLRDALVFIRPNGISYYKVDSPSSTVFPNSELSSEQTYEPGLSKYYPPSFFPETTSVGNTLTISVFDSNVSIKLSNDPQYQKTYKKLREVMFTLP